MLSRRTQRDRTPNRLAVALAARRSPPPFDLTVSNPTRAALPYPDAAILAALADPRGLSYDPAPFGLRAAREVAATEVARSTGVAVAADRVMLTASTSEAYAFLFELLCDPGDEVLVPEPSYPLFDDLAALGGVRLRPYRLAYDGEWHVDLDHLRAAVGARTRAVLAVSPNNPTGSFLKRDELAALARLGLPIASDEVFGAYPLGTDPRRASTALEAASETLVFTLGGLSKLALLPQMKLAWTCVEGPAALRDEALARLELIADTFLSPSTPVQLALPRLLEATAPVREVLRARIRANLEAVRAACRATGLTPLGLEGGWYVTVRLPRTRSEEDWVIELLERDGVHVQPGWFFDFPEEAYVVISLIVPETVLAEGMARLVARVERSA